MSDILVPQKQLIQHDPENGNWGDCYRTCIAVILGVPAADVPHFCDGDAEDSSGVTHARAWLRPQGFGIWQSVYLPDAEFSAIMDAQSHHSPGIPSIVTGKGARDVNHCVVAMDGKVVCDPHSGRAVDEAFAGPAESDGERWWWVEVIARLPGRQGALT